MADYLAVIERGYRGAVETQFADVLYLVRELNRQFGGIDLALRGSAAGYAIDAPGVDGLPAVEALPGVDALPATDALPGVDGLPDPRRSLRVLLDEGVGVHVDRDDLAALGLPDADLVLPGISRTEPDWTRYRSVWFL